MPTKLRGELAREVALAKVAGHSTRIPVIVTLAAGADVSSLQRIGLEITHIYENIRSVAGKISAEDIRQLEDLEQVESIEFDGEVHAL